MKLNLLGMLSLVAALIGRAATADAFSLGVHIQQDLSMIRSTACSRGRMRSQYTKVFMTDSRTSAIRDDASLVDEELRQEETIDYAFQEDTVKMDSTSVFK